jgi:hypothetical protein
LQTEGPTRAWAFSIPSKVMKIKKVEGFNILQKEKVVQKKYLSL